MSKVIAISNQKGGVGKTTTAISLASALALQSYKVLLIDFDSQGNCALGLGLRGELGEESIYHALIGQSDIQSLIVHLDEPDFDFVPSSMPLAGFENEGLENERLKEVLEPIRDLYDFIFIDCPPALGKLNANALTAADSVLIPVQCEYYSLEGLTQLLLTIRMIQISSNPDLSIEGILITMFDPRTKLASDISCEVRQTFDDLVYTAPIPRNCKLSEAPSEGKTIYEYARESSGAKSYMSVSKEFLRSQT